MSATKQEVLDAMHLAWDAHPTMRFGQLVCNLAHIARGPNVSATWDMEDEELLNAIQNFGLKKNSDNIVDDVK